MERNLRPENVRVDIGSEGLSGASPSGRCSPPWPPCCPPSLRPCALAEKSASANKDKTIKQNRNAFTVVISFFTMERRLDDERPWSGAAISPTRADSDIAPESGN